MAQTWTPETYEKNARFVSTYGRAVVELLQPRPGEHILDLGCGDGALTEELAATGAHVTGVDASAEMVAGAKARGLDARLMRGEALTFDREFDAVFSNAALHWMPNPTGVIASVARALRPGGRFVGEFGGHGNTAAIVVAQRAILEPLGIKVVDKFFPTDTEYRTLLEAAGFIVDSIQLIPRPTPLPTGMSGWLDTFCKGQFEQVAEAERAAAKQRVLALLAPVLCDGSGNWTADYVRLRFKAHLA